MNRNELVVRSAQAPVLVTEPPSAEGADSLQELWRLLVRRRRLVLSVFAIVLALGAIATALQPRRYEAVAILMMSPREPEGVVAQQQPQSTRPADTGYVDSQVEILRSPALAAQLIERLDLDEDPEWTGGKANANPAAVTHNVMQAIHPRRRGSTYVVEVAVRSKDPQKAARMSNELVEIYLASRAQARIESAQRTSAWLERRLEELRAELREGESNLEAYRAETGLLTVNGVSLTEQQMQEAETTALAARVELAEREARWRQAQSVARSGGSGETMTGALTSEVMAQLRQRQADVDRRLAEYADRYGDLHPTVIAARAEQADIERQIRAEVGRLTESLRNEAEVARARAATLQGHLSSVRSDLVRNNAQLVRLNELERGVVAARAVYASLQQRQHELASGAAGIGGDAQLIAPGAPPTRPETRPFALMAGLAAIAGLIAGIFAALLAEKLGARVETAEEVERKIGLPVLTTIPQLGARELRQLPGSECHPGGFAAAKPRSAFTEAIRLLRTKVSRSKPSNGPLTVAIASALPREGKTTTALCLARVAAMSGKRVLLMDCDLRGRAINVLLGIDPRVGLLEVLRGERTWRQVVGSDDFSGAHVLPAAGDSFTPEDVFSSDAMHNLLQELRGSYDLIVLDCPPILTLAEARDVAVLADGVVIVARRGKTTSHSLRTAVAELREAGANIVGGALNGVDISAPGRTSYRDPLYFSHAQKGAYTT